jgi:hypothetical protein
MVEGDGPQTVVRAMLATTPKPESGMVMREQTSSWTSCRGPEKRSKGAEAECMRVLHAALAGLDVHPDAARQRQFGLDCAASSQFG